MLSIIIPNYNHAPYLRQRIESVLNQTYQDFELILLDDCSTDNSRDLLEAYRSHAKVSHVVLNETNSGSPFKQWVKGFELAKGKFIWVAESDDYSDTSFLERAMHRMDADQADIVFAGTTNVGEKGNDIGNNTRIERKKKALLAKDFTLTGLAMLAEFIPDYCIIRNASSALFKRSLLSSKVLEATSYRTIGDFYFWTMMAAEGAKVSYISQKLNFMRNHKNNVRQNPEKKAFKKKEYQRVENAILQKIWYRPTLVLPILKRRIKSIFNL